MGGAGYRTVGGDVVGDVQQARQEGAIGADGLALKGLAIGRAWKLLGIEAALGTDRNDDGVLDLLRLDQAQHLSAEVVAPI